MGSDGARLRRSHHQGEMLVWLLRCRTRRRKIKTGGCSKGSGPGYITGILAGKPASPRCLSFRKNYLQQKSPSSRRAFSLLSQMRITSSFLRLFDWSQFRIGPSCDGFLLCKCARTRSCWNQVAYNDIFLQTS